MGLLQQWWARSRGGAAGGGGGGGPVGPVLGAGCGSGGVIASKAEGGHLPCVRAASRRRLLPLLPLRPGGLGAVPTPPLRTASYPPGRYPSLGAAHGGAGPGEEASSTDESSGRGCGGGVAEVAGEASVALMASVVGVGVAAVAAKVPLQTRSSSFRMATRCRQT